MGASRVLFPTHSSPTAIIKQLLQHFANPVRHGLRAWQILALALWKGIGDDS